jgi:putative acetyltransferase
VTFEVRAATAADIDQCAAMYVDVAEEGRWIAAERPPDTTCDAWREVLHDRMARHFEADDHVLVVADSGGTVVGQASLEIAPYGVASLGMVVARGWRRRGIGTALLDAAVAAARGQGAHKVALQAWTHNTGAIALYRRAGFAQEGVLRRHYRRVNGELWDAVIMGLALDQDAPTSPGTAG